MARTRRFNIRVGQRGGPVYPGIEQPTLEETSSGTGVYDIRGHNAATDPLGIALKNRARESYAEYEEAERARNPFYNIGSIPDINWLGFRQALAERGVDQLRGGASAPDSRQLRGLSVQPDYFTTGRTFMGRINADPNRLRGYRRSQIPASLAALQKVTER